MEINTNAFRGFDIETNGLYASECQTVSWSIGDICKIQRNDVDETKLLQILAMNCDNTGLLTYMGGTQYGPGFDFPFLRTRCAILGVMWPFGGVPHVDIMPIIQKRFDTKVSFAPSLDDLTIDDLKIIIKSFGIEGKQKKKQDYIVAINTMVSVEDLDRYILDTFPKKEKEVKGLKEVYQLLTGEDPGDMRGDQVPMLWKQYQETHDNTILDDIRKYNMEDCQKVEILWEIIQGCVPSRDLIPEIL